MPHEKSEMDAAFKVVAIMQTLTEEIDEEGKRMLRKLFGLLDETESKNHPLVKKLRSEDESSKS